MPESETQTAPPQNAVGAKNPFVFLVGCARSGTTLLRRIIGAHPLIAVPPETHWLPRFCRKRWKVDDAVVVKIGRASCRERV